MISPCYPPLLTFPPPLFGRRFAVPMVAFWRRQEVRCHPGPSPALACASSAPTPAHRGSPLPPVIAGAAPALVPAVFAQLTRFFLHVCAGSNLCEASDPWRTRRRASATSTTPRPSAPAPPAPHPFSPPLPSLTSPSLSISTPATPILLPPPSRHSLYNRPLSPPVEPRARSYSMKGHVWCGIRFVGFSIE